MTTAQSILAAGLKILDAQFGEQVSFVGLTGTFLARCSTIISTQEELAPGKGMVIIRSGVLTIQQSLMPTTPALGVKLTLRGTVYRVVSVNDAAPAWEIVFSSQNTK